MEEEKVKVSSQDIANYSVAAGSVFTGVGNLVAGIKGNPTPATSNQQSVSDNRDTKSTADDSDEKGGIKWYVWAGIAVIVAALAGGAYYLKNKN